jgi:hypothetical protein
VSQGFRRPRFYLAVKDRKPPIVDEVWINMNCETLVAALQSHGLQHQLRAFGLPLWTERLQQ